MELGERFPLIGAALAAGQLSLAQADAIVAGMRKLPSRLTREELTKCQESILEHVETLGPIELRHLATRLMEVVAPDQAEADDARRLAAEERAALRSRSLRLFPDHHGSVRIVGQLPVSDAALLSAQLEALMPPVSTYAESGEMPTPGMRRADALVLLTQAAANAGSLPRRGGDRPTVHVTMDLETLRSGLGRTGLFTLGEVDGLAPGEARRLACDAHLIPMVLGTDSRPLDVGRSQRTFPPAVRSAIIERDKGCAFPGCRVPAAGCEAHHIVAWWVMLGPSALSNGVLLCPYHHRLVEPDPRLSKEAQWEVHLDQVTGLPWFTPPRHIDPRRRPKQHPRFILQQLDLQPRPGAPPCPPPEAPGAVALRAEPDASRDLATELMLHRSSAWHPDG